MSKPDTELLNEILNKYPYFQSAHLLDYLAIYFKNNIFAEKNLPQKAVFAGERSKIYHFITQTRWQLQNTEIKKSEPIVSETQKKRDDIIDKFLEKSPSVQRPKAEFYNPLDKAAKSIIEEEEFVSETLAVIYERLNKFEKASGIYKKLCLLYPEKSNYFAARIEYLKNKIDK